MTRTRMNWPDKTVVEVTLRYAKGETPEQIAVDYPGMNPHQITGWASKLKVRKARRDWAWIKQEIEKALQESK